MVRSWRTAWIVVCSDILKLKKKNQSAKFVLSLCLHVEGLSWLQNPRVNRLDLKDDRLQRLKLFYLYAEKSYSKLDF